MPTLRSHRAATSAAKKVASLALPPSLSTSAEPAASSFALLECLEGLTNAAYSKQTLRFFHRSYCPNDIFVGIRVPQCRAALKTHLLDTSLDEIVQLIQDARHEMRLTGFIALSEGFQHPKKTTWWPDTTLDVSSSHSPDDQRRLRVCRVYLAQTRHCNNWDLVDASANLLGDALVRFHASSLDAFIDSNEMDVLPEWYQRLLRSSDLWETRISIVLLLKLLKTPHIDVAYAICLYHIDRFDAAPDLRCSIQDTAFPSLDLIHKALGWILREAGKHNRTTLSTFLATHSAKMAKTSVRYATEHMDKAKGKRLVALAKKF
ncbi:Aste57867_11233 [Aphanomyces stellatus]|uniref:Aste57867_11233 protein n=1 Tax=Aphanomyces stellatus TaxID=120398 RepID=A0A485KSW9_9STRA|nr:hypothetical protein As57867_011191 [Aphanomyces stellatus]VFT88099.1 Aste57867_11233 [Aphanomyces stellatus]